MVYIHSQPESAQDERQLFAWDVLAQALERTRAVDGDYEIREAPIPFHQKRQIQALGQANHHINIALQPVHPDMAQYAVAPVRIPVMGGMWGYRVMLERRATQPAFDAVHDLGSLRSLSIGQSSLWPDSEILAEAGLTVVTGDSYEGLFRMLDKGRFDGFSRSIIEVVEEYESRKTMLPDVMIERHLLLHYPMPEYFWFPDDPEGRRLAARVRRGLQTMVADRSLCQRVERTFKPYFETLQLGKRELIEIPNPFLGPEDHLDDPAYWCVPAGLAG